MINVLHEKKKKEKKDDDGKKVVLKGGKGDDGKKVAYVTGNEVCATSQFQFGARSSRVRGTHQPPWLPSTLRLTRMDIRFPKTFHSKTIIQ